MAKAKACPVCGSNKWRKDAISGNAACEEGHVFQDYRSENLVVENLGVTLQKRTFRKKERRNKRREEGRADASLYHGEEAEWLKLQSLQLMLRLQVQRVRELWNLTEAFETIIRELWAYQLATAQTPNPPGHNPSETNADPTSTKDGSVLTSGPEEEKTKDDADGNDSTDSEEGDQTEKEEGQGDIDEDILAELSDLSDISDTEQRSGSVAAAGKGPKWRRRRRLKVSDTLVTLILGLWIMKVPIMNADIESLINNNDLPYLDFARTTFIPEEMFKRMNRDIRIALTPRKGPSALFLFEESRHFARILNRHFGLDFPEINLPPISWRVVSSLGGTPTLYQQVHRLVRLLNVNLKLLDDEVAKHTRKARRGRRSNVNSDDEAEKTGKEVTYERTRRNQDVILPELSVAAAWVVVMKLAYGLDGEDRAPVDPDDPVIGMPEIEVWAEELSKRLDSGALVGSRNDLKKQSRNFPVMSTDDIDRYMDQCETVLLSNHTKITDAGPFPLLPISTIPPKAMPSWGNFHQSSRCIAHDPYTLPGTLQPGEQIQSYDAQDLTGQLPPQYEIILKAAAQVIGVKAYDVGVVVELFERKLEGLRKERSRSRSRSRNRIRSESRGGSRGGSRATSVVRRKRD